MHTPGQTIINLNGQNAPQRPRGRRFLAGFVLAQGALLHRRLLLTNLKADMRL